MNSVPMPQESGEAQQIERIKNVLSSLENPDTDAAVLAADIALRAFGDCLTRDEAAALLPMWKGFKDLSAEQVAIVLDRFGGAL